MECEVADLHWAREGTNYGSDSNSEPVASGMNTGSDDDNNLILIRLKPMHRLLRNA